MAPVKKPINWPEVEVAMMAGSTQEKIASSQNIDRDTLRVRFREEYGEEDSAYQARKAQQGESLLEVAQFRKALDNSAKGNTNMLIWLGKVRLGQREPEAIMSNTKSPNDIDIEKEHENIHLKHKLQKYIDKYGDEPETG